MKERISLLRIKFLKSILTEKEFNQIRRDEKAYKGSLEMYDEEYIDSVNVIALNEKRFIFLKKDMTKLHTDWMKTLGEISLKETLINPVHVEVESNGLMIVE